jgi:2-polyprenyl-3-methyl-5-hydroxy-6-metoxy-1,4-benzoquinol methylase
MEFLDDQPCPVCGHRGSRPFHVTTYPEHRYRGAFTLRACERCGMLFNSPRLDLEGLAQLYGRNYYFFLRKDEQEFSRIVAMYQRTIGLLDLSVLRERKSIDIGCGRGYFPAVLKKLGWDAHGIEISPDAGRYARETFGLDVFTGTIEKYATSVHMRQFPLVTAIDVIEHVPNPDAFVYSASKIVAPGGYLIIDTPNAFAHNIKLKGVSWKGFNPFHIYLFAAEHLEQMLARHGMQPVQSFSYGNIPTRLDLRDRLIAGLKRAHLLRPVVSAYFALKKMSAGGDDPAPHVDAAAKRIQTEPPYTATQDHLGVLSATKTGDNVVVIARKP